MVHAHLGYVILPQTQWGDRALAVPQRRNPQPCGFFNDPSRECHCSPLQIQRYVSKISGPLLDRIDIHIDMPAVKYRDLREAPTPRGLM